MRLLNFIIFLKKPHFPTPPTMSTTLTVIACAPLQTGFMLLIQESTLSADNNRPHSSTQPKHPIIMRTISPVHTDDGYLTMWRFSTLSAIPPLPTTTEQPIPRFPSQSLPLATTQQHVTYSRQGRTTASSIHNLNSASVQ
jgi:hypothetical protein